MVRLFSSLLIIITLASCASNQTHNIPPEGKSLISTRIKILENDTARLMNPYSLYFIKIDSPEHLQSDTIIKATKSDSKGYVYLIAEPGTYALIGAYYLDNNYFVHVFFDEELVRESIVTIEQNEGKIIEFKVLAYQSTLFSKVPALAAYYQKRMPIPKNIYTRLQIGKLFTKTTKGNHSGKNESETVPITVTEQ